jgi:AraC-like DNA-binding protein
MFDFVASSEDPAVSVQWLCNAAGIHERTLERAVRAKFDCTVQDLLRRRRFHEARRKLLFADPGATTVTRISYELGFYDGGRFAKDYHSCFGEFPSQTLKSPPIERVEPLLA